jgi:hypothetical protein
MKRLPSRFEPTMTILAEEHTDMRLLGRSERRTPLAITVLLLGKDGHQVPEQVTTENVSRRGARITSKQRWRYGQKLQVAPFADEFHDDALIIYCVPGPAGHFHIGLEFRGAAANWWGDVVAEAIADQQVQQAPEVIHAGTRPQPNPRHR